MDFRGPQQVDHQKPSMPQHAPISSQRLKNDSANKFYRISQSVLLLAVAIVLVGLLVFLAYGNSLNNNSQSKYIIGKDLQAVFLNSGQVYFGKIKNINGAYFNLVDIFYLQSKNGTTGSTGSATPSSVTLVKLGCELHAPLDQMLINSSQVSFWENLSPNGQVSKAVATFWKQNPNGQKCAAQSTAGNNTQKTPQTSTNNTPGTTVKP